MLLKLLRYSSTLESLGKVGRATLVGRYSSAATLGQPEVTVADQETASDPNSSKGPFPENNETEVKLERKTGYISEQEEAFAPFRYVYPEFLPTPVMRFRNKIREKLERVDMLKRRSNLEIPEFYVGSILSVTVSDRNAPAKTTTFVGICTEREGTGLRANFTLRNVVDDHGVEICYDLYNPTILNITCLRLEKRLDDTLRYLRDAPLEYSTFPFDMTPELRNPDAPVTVNPVKVKLNPKPWTANWQMYDLKGIEDISYVFDDRPTKKRFETWKFGSGFDTNKYDLMLTYRSTIPADDQTEIFDEVHQQLAKLSASLRKQKKKRTFIKPQKLV